MFELQETKNAHTNPSDDDFETVSRHRTVERAIREIVKHKRQMKKICGVGAWDHNHRIIDNVTGKLVEWLDG